MSADDQNEAYRFESPMSLLCRLDWVDTSARSRIRASFGGFDLDPVTYACEWELVMVMEVGLPDGPFK